MTQAVAGRALPEVPAATPSQAQAFTDQLQAQMLLGGGGAGAAGAAGFDPSALGAGAGAQGMPVGIGGLPVISAEQLMPGLSQAGGTGALGIQALLAGQLPGAAGATGGPTRLKGDLDGLDPGLRAGLEQVAERLGKQIDVVSGHRSYDEQAALYQKYLNGTGNLAARPGTSNHESGNAADVYIDGVALGSVAGGREAAAAAGLHFPVRGEAWHVERRTT